MTVDIFLLLLTTLSVVTSLCTEGVKKFLTGQNIKYASNIVVLVVAVIVGGSGTIAYYVCNDVSFSLMNVICIIMMIVANWLGSMVGYDKVKQAIIQIKFK